MKRDSFEYQVGLLLMAATGSDGDYTEKELNAIHFFLTKMFETMGSNVDANDFMNELIEDIQVYENDELAEKIQAASEFLLDAMDEKQLNMFYNGLREMAAVDGIARDEKEFLKQLKSIWFE